jgi:hypothetical protein
MLVSNTLKMKRLVLAILLVSSYCLAEDDADESSTPRAISILQTTIAADLDTATKIQNQLADKYKKTGVFEVDTKNAVLAGYGDAELKEAYSSVGTDLISFAYVDKERVALFLFDKNRPNKYIATSDPLAGNPVNRITDEWIELRLTRAFNELMRQYSVANFEEIAVQEAEENKPPELSKAERGKRLFNELSTVHEGDYYLGANLGMTRFSAQGASASTVNVGFYAGRKMHNRFRLELGADIFSYLMLHGDVRYQLPVAEKYISLSLGLGLNHIALPVTQNRGFNPTYVTVGQLLFGPSLSLEVPLLGASVRGDVRVLFGQAFLIVATYGLSYTL